jgi:hypothetical protein
MRQSTSSIEELDISARVVLAQLEIVCGARKRLHEQVLPAAVRKRVIVGPVQHSDGNGLRETMPS